MDAVAAFLGIARDSFLIALAYAGEWLFYVFFLVHIWVFYMIFKFVLKASDHPHPNSGMGFLSRKLKIFRGRKNRRIFGISLLLVPFLLSTALIVYCFV